MRSFVKKLNDQLKLSSEKENTYYTESEVDYLRASGSGLTDIPPNCLERIRWFNENVKINEKDIFEAGSCFLKSLVYQKSSQTRVLGAFFGKLPTTTHLFLVIKLFG